MALVIDNWMRTNKFVEPDVTDGAYYYDFIETTMGGRIVEYTKMTQRFPDNMDLVCMLNDILSENKKKRKGK